jgi:hypothetical protein
MAKSNSKIYYYGVDSATKSINFWGIDNDLFTGVRDDETGEIVLNPFTGALPPVMFPSATSYRILDTDGKQIIFAIGGQNYLGEYYLTRFGANAFIFGTNNVAPTSLSQLASSEDQMAEVTASPLVPILLIAAAYFIFIK